jgi:hypothetical protein
MCVSISSHVSFLGFFPSLLLPPWENGKLAQGTRTLQEHTSPLLGKGGTVDGVMSSLLFHPLAKLHMIDVNPKGPNCASYSVGKEKLIAVLVLSTVLIPL